MRSQLSAEIGERIRQLAAAAARDSESSAIREAAQATGGLPVHVDMGGALALTANGDVVQYDFENEQVKVVAGDWRALALAKAARRFPGLEELAPARPNDAIECSSCSGTGVMSSGVDCGTCWGAGWTSR